MEGVKAKHRVLTHVPDAHLILSSAHPHYLLLCIPLGVLMKQSVPSPSAPPFPPRLIRQPLLRLPRFQSPPHSSFPASRRRPRFNRTTPHASDRTAIVPSSALLILLLRRVLPPPLRRQFLRFFKPPLAFQASLSNFIILLRCVVVVLDRRHSHRRNDGWILLLVSAGREIECSGGGKRLIV